MEAQRLLNIDDWGHIDIQDLEVFGDNFSITLLEYLLQNKSFHIGVFINDIQQEPLWLAALDKGEARWQVGYPMLTWKYGKDQLIAPIFLWDIEIEVLEPQKKWMLHYDANRSARLNIDLKDYLKDHVSFEENFGLFPNPTKEMLAKMGSVFEHTLKIEHCFDATPPTLTKANNQKQAFSHAGCLLAQAQFLHPFKTAEEHLAIEPAPPIPAIEPANYEEKVVGEQDLYTNDEEVDENENLESPKSDDNTVIEPTAKEATKRPSKTEWKTALTWSLPQSSPIFYQASETCWKGQDSIHFNTNNETASDWVASLLPNCLADQRKVLIITEDESWQYDLRIKLEKNTNWRDVGFWVGAKDTTRWKENLETYLNQLPKLLAEEKELQTDYETYRNVWYTHQATQKVLNANVEHIQQGVQEQQVWTESVATYLAFQQKGQQEWVATLLKDIDFSFNAAEYESIMDMIHLHEPLYKDLLTLEHPLLEVQDQIIEGHTLEQADKTFQEYLLKVQGELLHVQRQYMEFIAEYSDDLRRNYEEHAIQLRQLCQRVIHLISLYDDVYGEEFTSSGTLSKAKLSLFKVFSKRSRQVAEAREQLFDAYDKLADIYTERNLFEARLPNIRKLSNLQDAIPRLDAFVKEIDAWEGRIEKWVEQKLNELTTQLPIKLDFRRKLKVIEEQFNRCLLYIREEAVVQKYWELREINVYEQLNKLGAILTYYRNLSIHYRDFEAYFRWRQHWLIIDTKGRAVIEALVQIDPLVWDATFGSWYLRSWLLRLVPNGLNAPEVIWSDYEKNIDILRAAILEYGLQGHRSRQDTLWKQENWVKEGRNIQGGLGDFIASAKDRGFQDIFPFIVATPQQAKELLIEKQLRFDLAIVFDKVEKIEASFGSLAGQWLFLSSGEVSNIEEGTWLNVLENQPLFQELDWKNPDQPAPFIQGFKEQVEAYVAKYISPERLKLDAIVDGIVVDIVVLPIHNDAAPIAILCEGGLAYESLGNYELAAQRDKKLREEGYVTQQVWSLDWLKNTERAVQKLVAFIVHWDNQYLPTQ